MVWFMSTEQTESTQQPSGPAGGPPPADGPVGGPGGPAGPVDGPPPAEWGAPPPPAASRSTWTTKRTIIALVVAVGIAAAGGVAIYAASGSVNNNAGGPGGGKVGGPVMVGGPIADLQHGEFQTGDITAISDSSITVKSEDGYQQTYALTSDTQKTDGLAKGVRVTVMATTENNQPTARSVMEFGAMGRRNGGPNGGNGPNGGRFSPPGDFTPANGN